MTTDIGFDLISDLFLSPNDSFNWENKATSLFCIVAGNISSDLSIVFQTLTHLSKIYQGVFYVPGYLEYETADHISNRTDEITEMLYNLKNVCFLYQNVVVINNVAIVGVNGWSNTGNTFTVENIFEAASRYDDFNYLYNTLGKLQKYMDVAKIIVVSNAVPQKELFFGETPIITEDQVPLCTALKNDTEHKVAYWAFGTYEKLVDINIKNINYVNNPYLHQSPYWAKRISISV